WTSREILSRPEAARNLRAGRHGGYRIFTLVRATAGRVGVRGMDRRPRGDQDEASQETEDRPRTCPTYAEAAAGKSVSSNLGARSGESRSATTAVAPASVSPKFQPTVEARFEVKILKMCGLARAATWFSFICVLM